MRLLLGLLIPVLFFSVAVPTFLTIHDHLSAMPVEAQHAAR